MRFHFKIEKENVGCGVPGCSEGCDSSASLSFYVLATSKEDAERFAQSYFDYIGWDNSSFTVEETTVEFPEMTIMTTPSFEAEQFNEAYAEAEDDVNKAREELHVLIKYGAVRETLDKAMDKLQLTTEHCAFLRGG